MEHSEKELYKNVIAIIIFSQVFISSIYINSSIEMDDTSFPYTRCCAREIERCPYKRQVTTINEVRNQCLRFCHAQPAFKSEVMDMYSSDCGKFCQKVVDQTIKKYGYSPCEKKIQPAVYWYSY